METPEFDTLFGDYLHLDWTLEYSTPEEVIDVFLRESEEQTRLLVEQMHQRLAEFIDGADVRAYLWTLSSGVAFRDDDDYLPWLRAVLDRAKASLHQPG